MRAWIFCALRGSGSPPGALSRRDRDGTFLPLALFRAALEGLTASGAAHRNGNGTRPFDPRLLGPHSENWRREADYWQRRIERSDDQGGALLTACLTVGAIGAAAAGFVDARPDDTPLVVAGICCVAAAGGLTLLSRTFVTSLLTRGSGGVRRHQSPRPHANAGEALNIETVNAELRRQTAKRREQTVGLALLVFTIGLVLIAVAALGALGEPPPTSSPD